MKVLVLVAAIAALAQGFNVKPAHIRPNVLPRRAAYAKFQPRITGGDEAEPHSLPYQVGLFIPTSEGLAFCGGSLLSPTTVVTAAHCGELSDNIEVVLGAHKIRENEETQIRVNSSEVIVHPGWNRLTLLNDIAIIRLAEPVELNENVNVVPLPASSNNDYLDDQALASGWGLDSDEADTISEVLREVVLPVGSNLVCNLYYLGVITDSHICGNGDGGRSTCSGDSGGPLVASTGELIGITSFGISFGCEIGWPAVFTRVTSFLDWIAENSDVELK